ncbi:hypothetical protein C1H46_013544 [Malus baccata]|uniref:Uncharacterized protein n=1 Tax=Malus baccata TaxID=106549 RepID=A0A540MPX5_MALBA|nr:hypothetical protein C1H46_013544 [Malus baccata]
MNSNFSEIQDTIRESPKRQQYASLADLLEIPEATEPHRSQVEAVQQDKQHDISLCTSVVDYFGKHGNHREGRKEGRKALKCWCGRSEWWLRALFLIDVVVLLVLVDVVILLTDATVLPVNAVVDPVDVVAGDSWGSGRGRGRDRGGAKTGS